MPITALLAPATAAMATGFAWRRTGRFSPATPGSRSCVGHLAVLYAAILRNVHLPSPPIGPTPSIRLGDRFAETAAFFAALSLIARSRRSVSRRAADATSPRRGNGCRARRSVSAGAAWRRSAPSARRGSPPRISR